MWGDLRGDLPSSYRQLTRLRYLTLTNCGLACLPPTVRDMGELRLLKVNINSIKVSSSLRRILFLRRKRSAQRVITDCMAGNMCGQSTGSS